MTFRPRSIQQIVAEMAATLSSETPINDFTPGSVALTLLQAAAQEDFQQYIQMIEVVRNYNLDTTEGDELDLRAFEFGLVRQGAKPHSGFITITDSRFDKIQTKLYSGLPGPTSGSITLYVDDASALPASGSIYVGRGTENTEGPIAYSTAPVDNTSFWTITLDTALINDHGTDETIILSQFGQRTISTGTEVRIPENDFSAEILFELNQTITLLDGENAIENVLVTALEPGGTDVPRNSIKEFVNAPFTGAVVANPAPFVNGRDEETDQELRDRIRDTIQSLSRGTSVSVNSGILGIIDTATNSSITSANVIPPVILADGPTKVFIDNGRGLEPEIESFGLETLITSATGGEKFFQLTQFPVIKANIVSQLTEPFDLSGGETIILKVGTTEETFTFDVNDFSTPGTVQATEAAEAINNRANLFEARTITDETGARVILTPIASQNENIKLNPSSTANTEFNFSTDEVFTLKLYKNDQLLTKDGLTASLTSASQPFDLTTSETTTTDDVVIASGTRVISKLGIESFVELVNPGDYVKSSDDNDTYFTKVRTVVDANKIILEEDYPDGSAAGINSKLDIWSSPQLEVAANGDLDETEIVSFSKNDFSAANTVLSSEALTRIQQEINLSKSELAVNDTQVRLTSLLENSDNSKMRVLGGHGALAMGFCTTYGLTGVCNFSADSKTVTGSGTLFTQELEQGQWIKATSDNNGAWSKIESIENDDTLHLTTMYRGLSASSQATLGMTFSEETVGSDEDYILNRSNGQIELVQPLVAGDNLTAGSANTRAFTDSIPGAFNFDSLGATSNLIVRVDGGVSVIPNADDNTPPYNTIFSTLVGYPSEAFIGNHIECISGANTGQTEVITGYNPTNGDIFVSIGFTNPITSGDKFIVSQIIEFNHSVDFVDDTSVPSSELVTVINAQLNGATAQERANGSTRIRTNNFESGSIGINSYIPPSMVIGGTANGILSFSTTEVSNQESNIASLISGNSDRGGLSDALGYTLGPAQNIVIIFDDDSANKTFTSTMRIEGEITSGVSNSLVVSDFIGKYSDDFFNDFWVYWKEGASNEGSVQLVTDFDGLTGTITTTGFYPSGYTVLAPVAGDFVQLVPRTAENLVNLFSDLNTTTLTTAGNVEAINPTGDFLQISTKLPGTSGKVVLSGGTANSIGISIIGPVVGEIETPGVSEIQSINFSTPLTSGDFTIEFDGYTTAPIAVIPPVNEVQNVSFSLIPDDGSFTLVYDGQQTAPLVITPDANEVQRIIFGAVPDSGNFEINFDGQTTSSIAYNASNTDIKNALQGLSNIDLVSVTGSFALGIDIEFQGINALTNVPQITIPTNTLELSSVSVSATPTTTTEGSSLTYPTNGDIETALEALSNIDNVSVSGGTISSGDFDVEFQGSLAGTDVTLMTVGLNTLTDATVPVTIDITETTAGAPFAVPEAADVEAALETLSNIDDVIVTGDASTSFVVEFAGSLADTDVALMTIPSNTTNASINVTVTQPGVDTIFVINKIQTNSIAGLSVGLPVEVSTNLPTTDTVFISEIEGTIAPYSLRLSDIDGNQIDASSYTSTNEATIADLNGLDFSNIQVEGIDGYKFYSGLVQLAQWTIDGLDRDRSNYPGIGAAGTQFEVIPPVLVKLEITVNVTPVDGVSLSSISNDVSSAILSYVNSRSVGEDVIISEVVAAAQSVTGVFDVEVTSQTENITIADGELARLDSSDLIVG